MLSKAANFLVILCLCCAKFSYAGTLGKSSPPEKRSLQLDYMTYECAAPLGPLQENWFADASSPTGKVCYNNISTCCGALQEFTSCADPSTDPWPGGFVNGVCSGYSAYDCCYTENGYTEWNFSACYESQEKILVNWNTNATTCTSVSVSNCCGTRQEYTSCAGSSKPFPGKWNGDTCSGFSPSDCCFAEDYFTSHNFIACYDNQEMIEGQWSGGDCYATLLSQCCRSTDTTGSRGTPTGGYTYTGGSSSISSDESSNAAGVAIGVVVGVLVVAAIAAVVCLRHRSCPLYGKMNCAGINKPPFAANPATIPTTVEDKPFSASIDPSETATESTGSHSGGGVHHHFATMANVINSISNVASTVESVSNSINNVAQIASLARGGPLEDLENATVSELNVSNAEYVDVQGTTVNA
jgi:hypothetical protein